MSLTRSLSTLSAISTAVAIVLAAPASFLAAADCNLNGRDDSIDLSTKFSFDCNADGVPDECAARLGYRPDTAALYRFDEISGAQAFDRSGNGNHGNVSGAASSTAVPFPHCKNRSLEFDHMFDAVTIPAGPGTNLHTFEELTLEAYVLCRDAKPLQYILWADDDTFGLRIQSGQIVFVLNEQQSATAPFTGAGVWSHVVATYDGSRARIYVDNRRVADEVANRGTITVQRRNVLRVGNDETATLAGFNRHFRGNIDQVRIASRVLSGAEIAMDGAQSWTPGSQRDCNRNGVADECDLFSGTSEDCNFNGVPDECDVQPGFQADSAALYRFDLGETTQAFDHSGNGNHATYSGTTKTQLSAFDDCDNLAVEFDHKYDSVTIPAGPSTNLNSFSALTLEAYVLSRDTSPLQFILWADDGPFSLFIRDNQLAFSVNQQLSVETPFVTSGAWRHVAASYDGVRAKLYTDGRLVADKPAAFGTINVQARRILRIGNDETATFGDFNRHFRGLIDQVRIVKRVLSTDEIRFDAEHNLRKLAADCNGNGLPDACDINSGRSQDRNDDGIPDECGCDDVLIDFEDVNLGAGFGIGSTLVSRGVSMHVGGYSPTSCFGAQPPLSASIINSAAACGSGHELSLPNVSVEFDFPAPPQAILLSYGEYGGGLNIEINGDCDVFADFADIDGKTIGGVHVAVIDLGPPGNSCGRLLLFGQVNSFRVGGEEFVIDDIIATCEEPTDPDVRIREPELDFGSMVIGVPRTLELTIDNLGFVPAELQLGDIEGESFSTDSDETITIDAAESAVVRVTYTPSRAGKDFGELVIRTDASALDHHVDLTGLGVEPEAGECEEREPHPFLEGIAWICTLADLPELTATAFDPDEDEWFCCVYPRKCSCSEWWCENVCQRPSSRITDDGLSVGLPFAENPTLVNPRDAEMFNFQSDDWSLVVGVEGSAPVVLDEFYETPTAAGIVLFFPMTEGLKEVLVTIRTRKGPVSDMTTTLVNNTDEEYVTGGLFRGSALPALEEGFQRGDANDDEVLDVSDPVSILFYLFLGAVNPPCEKAFDADDSGVIDVTDPVNLLSHLFLGAATIPGPNTGCGLDPTPDDGLSCEAQTSCAAD